MENPQDLRNYLDLYTGLPVQKDGDGGDTAQRIGMICFGRYLNRDSNIYQMNQWLAKITVGPGQFVRNPDPSKWYSNPLNFSRDQTRSLVIAMGAYGLAEPIRVNLKNLLKSFGFYPNKYPDYVKPGDADYKAKVPDFASPEHYSEYIRALYACGNRKMLALYPVVLLGDCFKLLGALMDVFYTDRDLTRTDDVNSIMSHLQALKWMPTPLSWLARKIYVEHRPVVADNNGIQSGPESALYSYFFNDPNGIEPLYYIYKPSMDKYFTEASVNFKDRVALLSLIVAGSVIFGIRYAVFMTKEIYVRIKDKVLRRRTP